MIEDTAQRLFSQYHRSDDLRLSPEAAAAQWPEPLWSAVSDAGIPLALLSEADGGFGFSHDEVCTLVGLAARFTSAIPLGETLLGNWLLAKAGRPSSADILTLLPVPLSIHIDSAGVSRFRCPAVARTPFGRHASGVLAFAEADNGNTYLLELGALAVASRSHNLAGEARDTMTLPAQLASEQRHPLAISRDSFLAQCALMRAAAIAGVAEVVLEVCIAYANERKQFGRAIGKFQAIQHYLARMAGEVAASRVAVDTAARSLADAGNANSPFVLQAAAAKLRCGEAAGHIAQLAHQVHGAIGFSQEHALHGYTRRLWSWREEYGNEHYWASVIGNTLCQRGHEQLWATISHTQAIPS